jgi:hypothetical protein
MQPVGLPWGHQENFKISFNHFTMLHALKKSSFSKFTLLVGSLFTLTLSSCFDNKQDAPEPQPIGYLSIYHGSPSGQEFDVVLDGQRLNNGGFKYTGFSEYLRLNEGERRLQLNLVNAANSVIDTTFKVHQDKAYSFFITGVYPNQRLLAVTDSVLNLSNSKSALRIVHLAPDAPELTINSTGSQNMTVSETLGFKDITVFQEIAPGEYTMSTKGLENGETLLPDYSVRLEPGRAYTLVVRGQVAPPSGNNNTLSAQLIRYY